MEEKKISEQESLELITRMINQTKKDLSVGNGDSFLIWGYLSAAISLAVIVMLRATNDPKCGWFYLAIPIAGFAVSSIKTYMAKRKSHVASTYASNTINKVWAIISAMFAVYAIDCLLHFGEVRSWNGMFLLGMLLPGIGTYTSGVILKEKSIQICGLLGVVIGTGWLRNFVSGDQVISIMQMGLMVFSFVITLVIPGHILNFKAKKQQ